MSRLMARSMCMPKATCLPGRVTCAVSIGIVKSGYFKYVTLNSKGQEVATGFSFEGRSSPTMRTRFCDRPSLTSIVARVRRQSVVCPGR